MRFDFSWSLARVLGALTVFVMTVSAVPVQAGTEDDIHIGASAELFALYRYPRFKSHKAMAVGPAGYWGHSYGWRSASAAAKDALSACKAGLRRSNLKNLRGQNCVLFDVDGKRTGKAVPIGIPFGTVAQEEDFPWRFGKEWRATATTKRGTMLLLHGCDGFSISGWQMAWVNYYRAAGFRVIAPNSFAQVREPAVCGAGGIRVDNQTRNLKLRVAQTLRTLAGIRKKYPGESLYLHGHSEGGWIAQALGEKVDGVIVTGSSCGFGTSQVYRVAKGVPVLVIAGTRDDAIDDAGSAKTLSRYCRAVTGAGKMTWVSVAGMDHYAALWWPQVQDAVGKLLDTPSVKISRPQRNGVSYPDLPSVDVDSYLKARQHKAIAANKTGSWASTTRAGSKLDAEEEALFNCDEAAGADAYLDASHMHDCVLVDVNGKRLVK